MAHTSPIIYLTLSPHLSLLPSKWPYHECLPMQHGAHGTMPFSTFMHAPMPPIVNNLSANGSLQPLTKAIHGIGSSVLLA